MTKKMRKWWLLIVGALLFVATGAATQSEARTDVHIGVNLPVYTFGAPPEVAVIPGTNVYMVPDIDVDVLFYQGYWWRPYQGNWYRSRDYKGHYRSMHRNSIPRGLRSLPQDYRHRLSPGYGRVHHKDVQRNWKKWEKEKYWEKRHERNLRDRDYQGRRDRDDRDDQGRRDWNNRDDQGRRGHGDQRDRY